jgi:PadR family transcriptional regulator, regulatory protein AphA
MPQAVLTTLEYALLGLLEGAPMSGYDVSRFFATTPLAHFSSSSGAIYPALKRLEQRGLVMAALDTTTETRPRRVYSLTEAGRAALDAWLHQPVTRDELVRDGRAPLLRFSMAEGHLSTDEIIAYLEGFRREVSGYLDELRDYCEQTAGNYPLPARLALAHGLRTYECHVAWIDYALGELKPKRPARKTVIDW